jgi:hypothetical protein
MGRDNSNAKWTRGRSTVPRVTSGKKINQVIKEKALHLPMKFLNSLMAKKDR